MARRNVGGTYELVFNGVELGTYAKAEPYPSQGPTIFFLGRHEPRKGLAVLLEAMAVLPPDVRLWVAGEGPETVALRARVAGDPRIEWLGRISEADKAARLRAADVFCAPSLGGESFGVVLLEAMAAGTAVVATSIAGYAKVARVDVDALLVPPGDPSALAVALSRVLGDAGLRAALVASGHGRASEFSMDRLAEMYEGIFERVLSRR